MILWIWKTAASKLSDHGARIKNLEEYQEKQNGHLSRIEGKLGSIYNWLLALLGGAVVSLILLILKDVFR